MKNLLKFVFFITLCTLFTPLLTVGVVKSMDALGPAKAVMCIVIAQLIAAYLIEIFGLFGVEKQPFEIRKVIGMVVAIAGIVVFKWK